MSLALKHLGDGKIPATKTALYTTAAGYTATIHALRVSNVHTDPHQFIIYVKRSGGTSRVLWNYSIPGETGCIDDDPLVLNAGDSIEGNSPDGATYFDYSLDGTLELLAIPS